MLKDFFRFIANARHSALRNIAPIIASVSLGIGASCDSGACNSLEGKIPKQMEVSLPEYCSNTKRITEEFPEKTFSEINLNDTAGMHIISASTRRSDLRSLEIRISDINHNNFGVYSLEAVNPDSILLSITSPPAIFLPETSFIDFTGYDSSGNEFILADTVFTHELSRMIIVDRNGADERLYMILGDENFRFGYMHQSFSVSTGLYNRSIRHTPLGYWHVRAKNELAINHSRGWVMPWALWYFDDSNPDHPRNGIHEGLEGTVYGMPCSHGCTRVPEEFAEDLFNWAQIGTPVVYIDSTYTNTYWSDSELFDIKDYAPYRTIIDVLEDNAKYASDRRNFLPLDPYSPDFESQMREAIGVSFMFGNSCELWAKPDSSFHSMIEDLAELYFNSI